MRTDTESLNAQFERTFHNRWLPAWGLHNQTAIVLMAALAQRLDSPCLAARARPTTVATANGAMPIKRCARRHRLRARMTATVRS